MEIGKLVRVTDVSHICLGHITDIVQVYKKKWLWCDPDDSITYDWIKRQWAFPLYEITLLRDTEILLLDGDSFTIPTPQDIIKWRINKR